MVTLTSPSDIERGKTYGGELLNIGSLFSGYGGLDMAVSYLTNASISWVSDIEPASCTVLAAHHPNVTNIGDITKVNWGTVERVDILTAGYPCQPFSTAGHRKGSNDERHLWPYVRGAIGALGPRFVFLENVRGHLTLGFADVLADLAELGYDARWGVVRASDAGAPHQRSRLFVVAHPGGTGSQRHVNFSGEASTDGQGSVNASTSVAAYPAGTEWGGPQPHYLYPQWATKFGKRISAPADTYGKLFGIPRRFGGLENQIRENPSNNWKDETLSTRTSDTNNDNTGGSNATDFGPYAAAVTRWEQILGRSAPAPSVMVKDRPRLNPVFVEWMMGLPEGWVTGHGLSDSQALKLLGNGVVPQQALLAYQLLGMGHFGHLG